MPQFFPEHTPKGLDDFTTAYLDAAEWLLDEEIDRDAIIGWSKQALEDARDDCKAFQETNARLLSIYERRYGFGDASAGHDFWLTRNGHGAGFWDRGAGKIGDMLADACDAWGGVDAYLGDDGYLYFGG